MNIILTKLVSLVIAPVLLVTGFLGITPAKYESNLGATIPTAIALLETSLANSITADATSMTLVSATTKDGTTLATSTYGFIISEGEASEELVLATCVGTSCTGMTRGVSVITGNTSITALKKAHRRGASVKITDAPQLLILSRIMNGDETIPNILKYNAVGTFTASTSLIDKNYNDTTLASATSTLNSAIAGKVSLTGNETIAGVKTFSSSPIVPTPSGNTDAANKTYVDTTVAAGVPIANETTTGAGRKATSAQIASGYASTTPYFIPSSLASSTASTTASIVVVAGATGKIDSSFINVDSLPVTNSVLPKPAHEFTDGSSEIEISTNTTAKVGRVVIPVGVTDVTKVSFKTFTVDVAGTAKIALFTKDGQTQVFSSTTPSVTGDGVTTMTITSTDIVAGDYYLVVIPVGTANFSSGGWNQNVASRTPEPTGEPIYAGTLAVTASTMPATIDPTAITTSTGVNTMAVRLDQ